MSILKTSYYICIISILILCNTSIFAKLNKTCNLKVTNVLSGDTILVNNSGNTYKVRLIGIFAPLLKTNPPWEFAYKSQLFLSNLVNNQNVCIIVDSKNKTDKYQQVLAHVYKQNNNEWVNGLMIKQGLAYVYAVSPTINNLSKLIYLENIAIKNNLNIWSNENYKIITINNVSKHIGEYKIVTGTITNLRNTKKSIWLDFNNNNKTVFSIRIPKSKQFKLINWQNLLHKPVKIHGYIEQYSNKFSPFISLFNLQNIELLK